MKSRSFNILLIIALLLSLLGSLLNVTPARAADLFAGNATDLITSINTANFNGQDDTLTLTANITLTVANNGSNGLPIIGADGGNSLIINGNGFTIARSSVGGTPNFRIMEVGNGANLTLQNITISNGFTFTFGGAGGGVYNNSGSLTVINSVFDGNSSNCDPACGTSGGAISSFGPLSVSNSTFSNNSTDSSGGAIYISQAATITNSTFYQNSADSSGGAVYNSGSLLITNSTVSNNDAANGGGIHNSDTLTVANSTITDNSATLDGGGLYNMDGMTTSINSTFSDNGAVDGGNIYADSFPASEIELKNTIVSTSILFQNNCAGLGAITAGADTLATDLTCDSATPVTEGMLKLSTSLANNGGLTQTLALQSGSVAIDAGNATVCAATPVNNLDQRGLSRLQGASCDIGAYEYEIPIYTVTYHGNGNIGGSVPTDSNDYLTGDIVTVLGNTGALTKTGFTFNGWNTAADGTGTSYAGGNTFAMGLADVTLYAQWSPSSSSSTLIVKSVAANDGWVLESTETSNTGGFIKDSTTTLAVGDDAADRQYRSLLHFDTSALPDNAVITSVVLRLREAGVIGSNPFLSLGQLRVDMMKPTFGAPGVELSDFEAISPRVNVGSITEISPSLYSSTLNNAARNYLNKTGATQFRLYFGIDDNDNNSADFIRFFSGNAAAGDRPKLLISYTLP